MLPLSFTGHAIRDVGLMTLLVFCERETPADVEEGDLLRCADWLAAAYTQSGVLKNHVRGMYLLNAKYHVANADLREPFVQRVLYGWQQPPVLDEPCLLCGLPSHYRATREDMPLLTGRGVYNFSPGGRAGVPVCALCSLLTQMALMGCFKSERGLLLIYSDHLPFLRSVVTGALTLAMQAHSLAQGEKWAPLPFPKTRFVEQVLRWMSRAQRRAPAFARLEALYFSNSGPSPFVQWFHLDRSVVAWVDQMLHHPQAAVVRAFQRLADGGDATSDRRPFQEALLTLPGDARCFLRRYLLSRTTLHTASPVLVTSFLEEIMRVTPETIALLRHLGERFAHVQQTRRRFFYEFHRAPTFAEFRRVIVRAADDHIRQTGTPLITMDEFIAAFVPAQDEVVDWKLARDLITLYLLEQRAVTPDLLGDEPLDDDTAEAIEPEGDLT